MHIERSALSRRPAAIKLAAFKAVALAGLTLLSTLGTASAATLDRIRESGRIKLGYIADARPFTYINSSANADGYAIGLCNRIVAAVNANLKLPNLMVDWVSLPFEARFLAVQRGDVDILCTPVSVTLQRRRDLSFSIPIFPGGARAVVRNSASEALRNVLEEAPSTRVVWRGTPAAKVLERTSFGVVAGTSTEALLLNRLVTFQVGAKLVSVPDYRAGLQQLIDRKIDVFFGDRQLILASMDSNTSQQLTVLNRLLTHEPFALSLTRGDEDFRDLIDRALSEFYPTPEFRDLYRKSFGELNDATRAFFQWNTIQQ